MSREQDSTDIQALLDQLKSSEAWQKITNRDAANAVEDAATRIPSYDIANATPSTNTTSAWDAPHVADQAGAFTSTNFCSEPPLALEESSEPPSAPLGASVALLLSQLQGSGGLSAAPGGSRAPSSSQPPLTSAPRPSASTTSADPAFVPRPQRPSGGINSGPSRDAAGTAHQPPHTPPQDLRACTFQQALPHLARLAEDSEFLKALAAVRPGLSLARFDHSTACISRAGGHCMR